MPGSDASTDRTKFEKELGEALDKTRKLEPVAPILDANLANETFVEVDWANLHFKRCNFSRGSLEKAKLDGAKFENCKLSSCKLNDSNLSGTEFIDKCDLENAELIQAVAYSAKFTDANLKGAWATGAVFVNADFQDADLAEAHFERADLRGAKNIMIDGTYIENAQFSHYATDSWSLLRRTYTGPRFLLNLLFPAIFIVSIAAKSYGLWVLALLQQAVLGAGQGDPCSQPSIHCEHVAIWQIVTGWHAGIWAGIFVTLSLVYNALRLFVTLTVGGMRDEEERTGRSPKRKGQVSLPKWTFKPGYERLAGFHTALWIFQWVTFGLAIAGWLQLLATNLIVPNVG